MYGKNPEQYLAGLNLYPLKKAMVAALARKIFIGHPKAKLAGEIATNDQTGEDIKSEHLNSLLSNLNARLWAIFYSGQPLLHQTGETTIIATLDEKLFPQEQTIIFKRLSVTPHLDIDETEKTPKAHSFSRN